MLVGTEHKNLAYLQIAKRLNPRKSCWSRFFSWFNLYISYCPVSKNTKLDTLYEAHASDEDEPVPESIILRNCIVGPVTWEIKDIILQSQQSEPDPGVGPPNKSYVPSSKHTSFIAFIPPSSRTTLESVVLLPLPTENSGSHQSIKFCQPTR